MVHRPKAMRLLCFSYLSLFAQFVIDLSFVLFRTAYLPFTEKSRPLSFAVVLLILDVVLGVCVSFLRFGREDALGPDNTEP